MALQMHRKQTSSIGLCGIGETGGYEGTVKQKSYNLNNYCFIIIVQWLSFANV